VNKKKFSDYIKSFDFRRLFIDLGWDNYSNEIPISVEDEVFKLSGIVEKRGFVIVLCHSADNGGIPLHATRRKIENLFSKLHQEHLIIYENKGKTKQIWQYAIHERDKPKRVHEIPYKVKQDPEIIYQRARGLLFTLDEEENITLVDVIARIREGFGTNTEHVTKKFYDEFKKHHTSFLDFIEGIDDMIKIQDNKNKQWYSSLMLSRLMFCYFIQKKGYLNNDLNYLQNKLKEVRNKEGKNIFYGFYRDFLLQLFHQGLGKPQKTRDLKVEIGNIPYLNGGLFDVHMLERQFEDINIKDDAFERIFNFFDQWNWHLDIRVEATGRDINPDVIGYIFEKYVNDRAAMGAYYTKEDITDYIGKNTIIPFLLDQVKKEYPKSFKKDGYLWAFLKNSGDTYLYEAVKKGIYKAANDNNPQKIEELNIPSNIAIGLDTQRPKLLERRKDWNTKTPEKYALPKEIWRETIVRWKRYFELKDKITSGEITEINDFITYNLNIRQFIQDILENTNDPEFIHHFYKAIHSITILDPTCGSGAFLFAALNILETLYEACIERMEQFTEEEPRKYNFFHEVLVLVNSEENSNVKYYTYKTIILNNLYGIDIMHEAVEIAKLRLFLKMVGAVDMNLRKSNFGLEPLPDIDFNIRVGNTLVGFATEKEFKMAVELKEPLFAPKIIKDFEDEFRNTATAFELFQDAQLITDKGGDTHKKAKVELQKRLATLNEKLNGYLASTYGIDKNRIPDENKFNKKYGEWYSSHQPFHWFADFYEIINGRNGFDVVIGNPPYVEYSKIKKLYTVNNLSTVGCGNIYASVIETACKIIGKDNRLAMIVPLSALASSSRMTQLRDIIFSKGGHFSSYSGDTNPGILFEGVKRQLAILLLNDSNRILITKYLRWYATERNTLFDLLRYQEVTNEHFNKTYPKVESTVALNVINKILKCKPEIHIDKNLPEKFYFHRAFIYWLKSFSFKPYFYNERDGSDISTNQMKIGGTSSHDDLLKVITVLNSSSYYLYTLAYSDCRNIRIDDVSGFRFGFNAMDKNISKKLITLSKDYAADLKKNCTRKEIDSSSTGKVVYDEFYIKLSKTIIDNMDCLLAQHYGFTQEELDYIINYDIKYRMGNALFAEDD
jgi:hypothetical protein